MALAFAGFQGYLPPVIGSGMFTTRRRRGAPLLSGLSCVLLSGALAAPPPGVGFPEARLTRPVLGRVELPRQKDFALRMLAAGTRVERLGPEGPGEERVLLVDGATVRVPRGTLRESETWHTLSVAALRGARDEILLEPIPSLPLGVRYQWRVRQGARLHLVTLDLRANPNLEFFPHVTGRYNQRSGGRERVRGVASLGRRTGALVAINGPFFIPTGKHLGKPLGTLISGGELLFDMDDPYVLPMNRTYLAWTNAGRFVMGETSLTGAEILQASRAGAFAPEQLGEGEEIVSLVGGLGRLARDGDPEVWRPEVERQFGAHYYGRHTRRPQSILGLADGGRRLLILVQEGFPHSVRRFTLPELGHLLVHLGARQVAFTDGGGSTDLFLAGREVVRTENGGERRPNSCVLVVREKSRPGFEAGTMSRYSSS